jgi:AraC-like DNA-binding protein
MLQTIRASSLLRHVHPEPYVSLVISGGYEEAGDNGRFDVRAGNAVFHDRFEAHLDRFSEKGAVVLNLRLPTGTHCAPGIATVDDPESVAEVAMRNRQEALELVLSIPGRRTSQMFDWPDELAAELVRCPSLRLSQWGEENGLTTWTISRGFAQVFGISPEGFRAHVRARRALQSIRDTQMSLATIAAELGFADQSHMTRSVKLLTGASPQTWRLSANGFKTESVRAI